MQTNPMHALLRKNKVLIWVHTLTAISLKTTAAGFTAHLAKYIVSYTES